jgi:hypothetical protein
MGERERYNKMSVKGGRYRPAELLLVCDVTRQSLKQFYSLRLLIETLMFLGSLLSASVFMAKWLKNRSS